MSEKLKTLEGLAKTRRFYEVATDCRSCDGFVQAGEAVFQRLEGMAEVETGVTYYDHERCAVRGCEIVCVGSLELIAGDIGFEIKEYVEQDGTGAWDRICAIPRLEEEIKSRQTLITKLRKAQDNDPRPDLSPRRIPFGKGDRI